MRDLKLPITPELLDYAIRHGSRQDEVLARIERETLAMPRASMLMTPDQGALMTLLTRIAGATRALEVGTFTGYGAISIARGLAEGGSLGCLEVSEEYAGIARSNLEAAGVADRVSIRVGPAADALRAMPEVPTFDFVFLDADKQGNPVYYELVLPRMSSGGLVLIDNVLQGGRVLAPDDETTRTIHELNAFLASDERVDVALVPVADGLTIVRKR
ncbi:MAG: O-methyltransferase [Solirubrobacterales bacterium]|nr:O-methyltransferase [Solirubrobacterales bacterium]